MRTSRVVHQLKLGLGEWSTCIDSLPVGVWNFIEGNHRDSNPVLLNQHRGPNKKLCNLLLIIEGNLCTLIILFETFLRSAPPLIPSTGYLNLTFTADKQNCGIRFLEHVQVNMNLTFPGRGHLEMISKSPSGTKSQLLYPRFLDSFSSRKNLTNWNVTSLHYWGENPAGDWNITIRSTKKSGTRGKGNTRLIFINNVNWKQGCEGTVVGTSEARIRVTLFST